MTPKVKKDHVLELDKSTSLKIVVKVVQTHKIFIKKKRRRRKKEVEDSMMLLIYQIRTNNKY